MTILDTLLLWSVFYVQFLLAISMVSRWFWMPCFTAYLWVMLPTFASWYLHGTAQSLWWNLIIMFFKIGVAIEAAYVATYEIAPKARPWYRLVPIAAASALLVVLWIASPEPYPNFPRGTYYVRIVGHLSGMTISLGALVYIWHEQDVSFGIIKRHLGLLSVYFGSMLLASRVPPDSALPAHCLLMATHLACMVVWLRYVSLRLPQLRA